MTLMRVQIDKRTIGGLGSGANTTYAHGLGGIPDAVLVRFIATLASTTSWIGISAPVDVSNVTLQNIGAGAGGDMEVCTLRFHSLVQ